MDSSASMLLWSPAMLDDELATMEMHEVLRAGLSIARENGRYAIPRKYIGTFVGIVPLSAPRFVIAVMIDEPTQGGHYGGQVAAPTFAKTAENALRAMNVPPDSTVTEIVAPTDSGPEAM